MRRLGHFLSGTRIEAGDLPNVDPGGALAYRKIQLPVLGELVQRAVETRGKPDSKQLLGDALAFLAWGMARSRVRLSSSSAA